MATITGNNSNNKLVGTSNDDLILGLGGNDTLSGGNGSDTLRGGAGNDTIDGGSGLDLIDFSDATGGINFTLVQGSSNTTVNLTSVGLGTDTYKNIEGVIGSGWNDTLNGSSLADRIEAGGGNDSVSGGAGNDTLIGGAGNDTLIGGTGNDSLDGGTDNDVLDGGSGEDTLIGGSGDDTLSGGSGEDTLSGGTGNDSLDGAADDDILDGGSGDDTLIGGTGNDTLSGGTGNDTLSGGIGNDILDGGSGDDKLIGGAGADQLTGGGGKDIFAYLVAPDDSPVAGGWDRIVDFTQGSDKIDLNAFRGALDLIWSGTTAGTENRVWYDHSGTSTVVHADTDGNGVDDLKIELKNTPTLQLTSADFIGVDNAPVISVVTTGAADSAAKTLTEIDAALGTSGTLTVVDADLSDTVTPSVFSVAATGMTTGLGSNSAALKAMLTVTPASIAANTGDTHNLNWSFSSTPEVFNYLADGESLTLTYTVKATDDSAAFDDQTVTITITGTNNAPILISGVAEDGYLSGATVFADANANGVLEDGEAWATTGPTGQFVIVDGFGPLVLTGGTDTATNLPFAGKLLAPAGSTAITPLTTLISALLPLNATEEDIVAAQKQVLAAFGLDLLLDLRTLDAIAGAQAGNDLAEAAFVASAKLLNTVTMLASTLEGSGAGDFASASQAVFDAIKDAITSLVTVDLGDSGVILDILYAAASATGATFIPDSGLPEAAATVVVASNVAVDELVLAAPAGTAVLADVSGASIVAQDAAAQALLDAARGTVTISDLVLNYTGTALSAAITVAISEVDVGAFGNTIDLAFLTAAQGFRIFGADASDNSGWSVSSAGDVNGDGFDDVIVGALRADAAGNQYNAGESYVIFGKSTGFADIDLATLTADGLGFRILGVDAGDYSGISVSSAGDVNGDGFDDVIVGASQADAADNAKSSAGESYVIFGKSTGFADINLADALTAAQGFRIFGADGATPVPLNGGDFSGISVSSAGDVNGDGFDDVIVGASQADAADNAKPYAGESYVIFGKSTGFADINLAVADTLATGGLGFRILGADAYDFSGRSVSSAGDVNGDGFDDLIVGAYGAGAAGESYVIFGKSAFVADIDLSALAPTEGFRILGADASDSSGFSVSSAGDVNGDGFDDLIVGARWADATGNAKPYAGESYVIFGKSTFVGDIDLATLTDAQGFRILGADGGDNSGYSVSSAGDVNGDGFDDLIVGAKYADAAGNAKNYAGESYVIFGGNFTGAVTHLGTSGADALVGTSAAETFVAGQGNDTLTGGGGNDTLSGDGGNDIFDYNALSDAGTTGDVITDFQAGGGGDVLDLADLLDTFAGYTGLNAFSGGYLRFFDAGSNTLVQIDSNGGNDSYVTLATLTGVSDPLLITASDYIL